MNLKIMNKSMLIRWTLLLLITCSASQAFSQSILKRFWDKNKKYTALRGEEYSDELPVYIGIVFPHVFYSNYQLQAVSGINNLQVNANNGSVSTIQHLSSTGGVGVGVGIPIRVRVNEHISVESGVLISNYLQVGKSNSDFAKGLKINYHLENKEIAHRMQKVFFNKETNKINGQNYWSTEIPLRAHIYSDKNYFGQFSSQYYRLSLLGGINYITHLGANKYNNELSNFDNSTIEPSLLFKSSYLNGEVGVGFSFYSKYNKISLQAKYSQNITDNLLNVKRHALHKIDIPDYSNPYMDAIQKVGLRGWKLTVVLE
jgi:hypothetical protein